jgi:hypothetical protein
VNLTWVLLIVLLVAVIGVYTSWTAGRLDRLHARVDAAWAGLDAALVRRAAAAQALVPLLPDGPARDRLATASGAAVRGGPVDRQQVENDLTAALRGALPQLGATPELDEAVTRAGFARSFHNSAVADTLSLRRHRYPRALHLAGHRALPQHFDMDESLS